MILYHGTLVPDFLVLEHDRSGLGTHFGTRSAARRRVRSTSRFQPGEPRLLRYRLHVKNPLRMRDIGAWDSLPDVEAALRIEQPFGTPGPDILNAADFLASRKLQGLEAWNFLRRKIEERGYDSIIYQNSVEDPGHDSYIVWRDNLIEKLD